MKDKDTVSPKPDYEKWLANFQKFLDETPQEELEEIFAKVDAMGIEGPTVEEYSDAMNGHPNKIAALQSRIAQLEDRIETADNKVWKLEDENEALESRLSAANEYLKRNGMDVEF